MYRGFPPQPGGFGPPPPPPNGAPFAAVGGFAPRADAPRLFPPGACGGGGPPYQTPGSDTNFIPRPSREYYLNMPIRCSSFPIDRNTGVALNNPPQNPTPKWGSSTLEAPLKDNSQELEDRLPSLKDAILTIQQTYQQNPMFENLEELFNHKPPPQDHKNFQELLKNMGLNLASVDISKLFVKTEEKDHSPTHTSGPEQNPPVFPAVGDPNARQALETLQSLIKATKDKRTKGDVATVPQQSSDKHKPSHSADGRTVGDDPRRPGHHHHHTTTSSSSRDQPSHHPYHHQHHHHPATDRRDSREPSYHRDHRDPGAHQGPHRDHHRDYVHSDVKHSPHPRGHHPQELPEKNFLKEEMAKERLLITVARGRTPPPKIRPDEEMDQKSDAIAKPGCGQPEPKDSKTGNALKPARDSSSSSSSSEDDGKDRPAKTKTSKKKKKEKKKKDKKKKKKKKEKGKN
ncbi:hypothetical protein CRUP_000216 [Coryphaenoides rupestris]|nr:hypothetical protein CRUP_000216 [Coryphaenoides rupestris]